jgi:hypothetical protein
MDFVLKIWLKTVPEYAAAFCNIILVSSLLDALSGPLWITVQAVGEIKKFQICISCSFLLNIIFSYFFLKLGFSPDTVLQITVLVAVTGLLIRLLFVKYGIGMKINLFVKNVILRILSVIAISVSLPFVLSEFYNEWKCMILTSLSFFILELFSVYYIGVTESERKVIKRIVSDKVKIKMK